MKESPWKSAFVGFQAAAQGAKGGSPLFLPRVGPSKPGQGKEILRLKKAFLREGGSCSVAPSRCGKS